MAMKGRYKRPRFGRYIKIGPAKNHEGDLIEITLSSNGYMWNTIALTRHELRKLVKQVNIYLKNENLQ